MKKLFVLLIIILTIFLLGIINCQQAGSSGGGGGGDDDESSLHVIRVVAGDLHTVVLLDNGTIKCWGSNFEGQLGYGDINDRGDGAGEMGNNLLAVNLGTGRTITQIAAGVFHTVALLDNGTVKCWGGNNYGQLGYGDMEHRGDESEEMGNNLLAVELGIGRTATQIAAGDFHTVVLLDNGTVKCWGRNFEGQLGYEDMEHRGDESGEMGNNLLAVELGTGRTAIQIAAGGYYTVVLLDNGTVKCWGLNSNGQLGYGDMEHRGDESGEMGNNLLAVELGIGRTAIQIAAGGNHTVVLLDNGTVKCWGRNVEGQLGYGDINNRGDESGEMGNNLLAVELGKGRTTTQIAAGDLYTVVLLDNGTVKCWGGNNYGQLGYGDMEHRGDESEEMGNNLLAVELGIGRTAIQIAAGGNHTVVLLDNRTVKCWGGNVYGQLGYGDTETRGDEPGEMGNNLPFVSLW